jgi:hypothetical protein
MPTVEGIFRIIDRASGPMQRMERQARQTDRAIERLGMTTDMVGNQRQQRQLNDLDRGYRTFGRTVDDTGGRVRRASRDLESHERRWRGLRAAVTEAGAAIRGAGAIFGVLKFPVMAAGVGVLVQAVGALGGGIIGLTPRVADLSGAFAALGPTMAGLGLAMVTTNLAFNDFGKALGGNKNAIRALTPEARRFLTTLHEYRGVMKELRQSAQGGLFGGLDTALRRIQRGVPTANTLLSGMSRTLGGLATNAANRFTTGGFLQDILGIGQAGTRGVARGGQAIINIIDAMRQLTTAAIPFTDWVTRTVERIGAFIDRWAIFERDSGRFASFLGRSRQSLQLFARIVGNLLGFVSALGRAARPLGDLLWRDVERGTRAWSRYANSVRGQVRLTEDFVAMYPAIHEIVTLFDNLVRAVFQMGTSQQLPGIARTLDEMVPTLQHLLDMFVQAFGPPTLDLLTQFAQTLDFLVGATGPITIMLTLLARILGLVNALVGAVPGLGRVLATAFSVIAIGLFINRLRGVAAGWLNVAGAANVAAAAETRALAMGGAAGLAGGAAVAGEAVTAGGVILPAGVAAGGLGAASMMGRGSRLARLGRLGTVAGRLGTAAGRFALPVTGALGAYGALAAPTSGSFANRAYQRFEGGINAATGGLYGGALNAITGGAFSRSLMTPGQIDQRNIGQSNAALQSTLGRYGGDDPQTYAQVAMQVRILTAYTQAYRNVATPAYRAAADAVHQQLVALTAVRDRLREVRNENSRAAAYRTLRQEGQAFDIYAGKFGAAGAAQRTNADVLQRMRTIGPAGRQILAQQYLDWLGEESRRNPKLVDAYERMKRQVIKTFSDMGGHIQLVHGQIVSGTVSSWRQIAGAMTGAAEHAREVTNEQFTLVQQKALAVLQLMGVSPGVATTLVQGMESKNAQTRGVSSTVAGWYAKGQAQTLLGPGGSTRRGGPASGVAGNNASSLRPGIAGVAHAVTSMFPGLSMTSGVRPGDTGSYHSIGEAVDLAGPPTLMSRASAWIRANLGGSLLEGIHNTGLSIKNGRTVPPSFWGGSTWAGHVNHIHLAASDGGGVFGGGARGGLAMGPVGSGGRLTANLLRPRRSGLAGVPGTLADQVGLLYAAGAARNLNQRMAGVGASAPGTSTRGNRGLAYSMMTNRWGPGEWPALNALWTGESNFNATARNPSSGAYGIPQALPASKMGAEAAGGNAAAQIAWGLNYIAGRYGTPTNAYQTWLGRKPHWYRDGGSGTYRRPTLIGVGDNPRGEKVTVTPLGSQTAGQGRAIQVHIGQIVQNQEGDTATIIAREFELLARQLEGMPVVGDEETMR